MDNFKLFFRILFKVVVAPFYLVFWFGDHVFNDGDLTDYDDFYEWPL